MILIFECIDIDRVSDSEKISGSIRIVDCIPRNIAGKIARYELVKTIN